MPSQVVLADCLARYPETMGYIWPADAQRHCMVNEGRQLGVEFLLAQPCLGKPLQDLCRGQTSYPLFLGGRCRSCSVSVARLHILDLLSSGPAHTTQDAGWV